MDHKQRRGGRPRAPHRTHNTAAVSIALPEHEKEARLDYLDLYRSSQINSFNYFSEIKI